MDLHRTLFANILLSGGTTLCRGFGDRLLSEVREQAQLRTCIRIYAAPERKIKMDRRMFRFGASTYSWITSTCRSSITSHHITSHHITSHHIKNKRTNIETSSNTRTRIRTSLASRLLLHFSSPLVSDGGWPPFIGTLWWGDL